MWLLVLFITLLAGYSDVFLRKATGGEWSFWFYLRVGVSSGLVLMGGKRVAVLLWDSVYESTF